MNAADANAAVLIHLPLTPLLPPSPSTTPLPTPDSPMVTLLASLIRQPAFDELRTRQMLGYIISASAQGWGRSGGWVGLTVVVQGVEVGGVVMDERVDAFLHAWGEEVKGWEGREWEERRTRVAEEVARRRERMEEVGTELMAEVRTGRCWWAKREEEGEAVRGMGQAEFVEWYERMVVGEGRTRVSVEVLGGRGKEEEGGGEDGAGGEGRPEGSAAVDERHVLREEHWRRVRAEWVAERGD